MTSHSLEHSLFTPSLTTSPTSYTKRPLPPHPPLRARGQSPFPKAQASPCPRPLPRAPNALLTGDPSGELSKERALASGLEEGQTEFCTSPGRQCSADCAHQPPCPSATPCRTRHRPSSQEAQLWVLLTQGDLHPTLSLGFPICKMGGGGGHRQAHVRRGPLKGQRPGPLSGGKCLTSRGGLPGSRRKGGTAPTPESSLRSMVCVRSCWDVQGQDSLGEYVIPFASL